jgi:hypothetical protein
VGQVGAGFGKGKRSAKTSMRWIIVEFLIIHDNPLCRIIFCCDSSTGGRKTFFRFYFHSSGKTGELEKQGKNRKTEAEGIFGQSRWLKFLISCAHSALATKCCYSFQVDKQWWLSGEKWFEGEFWKMILLFWLAGWTTYRDGNSTNSSLTKAIYSLHFSSFSFQSQRHSLEHFFHVSPEKWELKTISSQQKLIRVGGGWGEESKKLFTDFGREINFQSL